MRSSAENDAIYHAGIISFAHIKNAWATIASFMLQKQTILYSRPTIINKYEPNCCFGGVDTKIVR